MKKIIIRILNFVPFFDVFKSWCKKSTFSFIFFSYLETQLFKKNGKKYKANFSIHPEDFIYKFIKAHFKKTNGSLADAVEYYFSSGEESAKKIYAILNNLNLSMNSSILEFASGYGCTTRHLYKYFNNVVTCDIHQEANLFNQKKFLNPYIKSAVNPKEFKPNSQYDVVFALSFFSHIPEDNFTNWLVALSKSLKSGGVLIFTTHGNYTNKKFFPNVTVNENGFWFKESSEQKDLSAKTYGTSIATKDFVNREIDKIGGLEILRFKEAEWWENQDSYVIKKSV